MLRTPLKLSRYPSSFSDAPSGRLSKIAKVMTAVAVGAGALATSASAMARSFIPTSTPKSASTNSTFNPNGRAELQTEVERLARMLSKTPNADPTERAVLEALSSNNVQDLLAPILDEGATLGGITMEAAGTIEGVMQLSFNTVWRSDAPARMTPPARVVALVQISPPRLLSATRSIGGEPEVQRRFVRPNGLVPVALRELDIASPQDILEFNRASNGSIDTWLRDSGLSKRLSPLLQRMAVSRADNTTGTKCSTTLCTESSADDSDTVD
jgi:hypothetical protein